MGKVFTLQPASLRPTLTGAQTSLPAVPFLSHAPSVPTAVVVEGDTYLKGDWMDSGESAELSPTVFLVEQGADINCLVAYCSTTTTRLRPLFLAE